MYENWNNKTFNDDDEYDNDDTVHDLTSWWNEMIFEFQKFQPAVNWSFSNRTVFVIPSFARWYCVWQPKLEENIQK